MYVVPFMLGESALTQQHWDEAAHELKKSLDLNANFDQAMLALSRALLFQGKPDAAKLWSQKALQQNPQNYRAWYQLGFIESKTDKAAAIADYEKAVAIQGNFASLRRDFGMLQFQQQNYTEAAKHLSRAAELGMNEALLFNFLGISYSRTGRLTEAINTYQRALKLAPNLAEAHLNLGFAYERVKRTAEAKREYSTACSLESKFCNLDLHRVRP
jgi:Flp pilus assembly protein TadD